MPNGIAGAQTQPDNRDPATMLAELRRTAQQAQLDDLPEVREALAQIHQALVQEFRPLGFVDEPMAVLITGRSARWLARRHADWQRVGGARIVLGQREYRSCVLPRKGIHHSHVTRA